MKSNCKFSYKLLEPSIKIPFFLRYWVFESWGRISTTIGNKRLTNYGSLPEAQTKFHAVYQEKTGNYFGRYIKKRPNKFYHHEIVFDNPKSIQSSSIGTTLREPVYQLMQLLFDIRNMEKNLMMTCDLDLKQMPLGKISKIQIRTAMTTLSKISCAIRKRKFNQLEDLSNEFYTLIPHSFGIHRPTIINSIEVVNKKNEMLESLLNIK